MVFAAFLFSWLTGFLALSVLFAKNKSADLFFVPFASLGVGLGITTGVMFFGLYFFAAADWRWAIAANTAVFLALAFLAFRRHLPWQVHAAVLIVVLLVSARMLLKIHGAPFGGGQDAWAIWKFKARFLFDDAAHWKKIFSPLLNYSHTDYPLFYPLMLVWGWLWNGAETALAAQTISFLFTVATVGSLAAAFVEKQKAWAMVPAFFVLSTPHFIFVGGSQYADILVAYFNLTAAYCVLRFLEKEDLRFAWLAGFVLGCGMFVKNEGTIFFVAAMTALLLCRKPIKGILAGALPWLCLVLLFRYTSHIRNEFFARGSLWQQLSEPAHLLARSGIILSFFGKQFTGQGYGWLLVFGAILLFFKRLRFEGNSWLLVTLFLTGMGYFLAYLVTPRELVWHLERSLDRLLMHLYPAGVLLAFRMYPAGPPWETWERRGRLS